MSLAKIAKEDKRNSKFTRSALRTSNSFSSLGGLGGLGERYFRFLSALQPPYLIGSSRDFWIVRSAKLECTRATPGRRVRCLLCKRSKSAVSATTARTT